MMEIPVGLNCSGGLGFKECPFLNLLWSNNEDYDLCGNPAFKNPDDSSAARLPGNDGLRKLPACLSAYPNGAVITITPREQFEAGFIPHGDPAIDPKTGVKTYDNVELVEVSIVKPK